MTTSSHYGISRKFGSPTLDADGKIVALHGKVKLGDAVTWLGRKVGSCSDDSLFETGQKYNVCFIYPSNMDVEIEQYIDGVHVTIRATEFEYSVE